MWANAELTKLCREVLHEIAGDRVELIINDLPSLACADICIWDFAPGRELSELIRAGDVKQHLFLVNRNDLDEFRALAPGGAASVLLKPVSRPTLLAFLSHAAVKEADSDTPALSSDRDDVLQCVIQANLKLQEYDQQRTNFLARAVHDLRAPLTSLCGYCALLTEGRMGELTNHQKETIDRMNSSARKLSGLVDALLQLSAGRPEVRPHFAQADLEECAEKVVRELTPSFEEKNISVAVDFCASPQPLYFDALKIEKVVMNLFDNSCRFTPRFGSIKITGRPYFWERRLIPEQRSGGMERRRGRVGEPNSYRVDIRDSGPGIPPQYLRTVFEEYTFYFGGADRSGGGLGLAICRSIVEAHGGCIWAENSGSGTSLSFVLPYNSQELGFDLCAGAGKERVI